MSKLQEVKEIVDKVLQIMKDVPKTRENDMYLSAVFWFRHQNFACKEVAVPPVAGLGVYQMKWYIDVESFKDKLLSFETIARARRKIQEEAQASGDLDKMKACLPFDDEVMKHRRIKSEVWRKHVRDLKASEEAWKARNAEVVEGYKDAE